MEGLKIAYSKVFSQCWNTASYTADQENFQSDVLCSATSLGTMCFHRLDQNRLIPLASMQIPTLKSVYSCVSLPGGWLLAAGDGPSILGWKWKNIVATKSCDCLVLQLAVPPSSSSAAGRTLGASEVLCITAPPSSSGGCNGDDDDDESKSPRFIFTGTGFGAVQLWDLETSKLVRQWEDHTDAVYSIAARNNGDTSFSFYTASEDGSCMAFDSRSPTSVHKIVPSAAKHSVNQRPLARPTIGSYLKTVSLVSSESWLLLGGGPALSSWHIGSWTPCAVYDTPEKCGPVNACLTQGDTLLVGCGSGSQVFRYPLDGGPPIGSVPVSPTAIYSIKAKSDAFDPSTQENSIITVSGTSPDFDLLANGGRYSSLSSRIF